MEKDNLPSFPFYPNDWLGSGDVSIMTLAEEGAFIRLLAYAWGDPDCGIPRDEAKLCRLLKSPDFDLENVIKKFHVEGDKLISRKLRKLKNEYLELRKIRAASGKKGGKSSWNKRKEAISKAQASLKTKPKHPAEAKLKPSLALALALASSDSDSSSDSKEKHISGKPDFESIIQDLNSKTGKNFKATTASTKRNIQARWNEGFRLEDFKKVHDNMTAKWLTDPKMAQYLRPETLYSPKFEGYLNTVVTLSDQGIMSASTEKGMAALDRFVKGGNANAIS